MILSPKESWFLSLGVLSAVVSVLSVIYLYIYFCKIRPRKRRRFYPDRGESEPTTSKKPQLFLLWHYTRRTKEKEYTDSLDCRNHSPTPTNSVAKY